MPNMPKFFVGDKITHKEFPCPVAEVTRVGKEIDYPGKGPARKIYWIGLNPLSASDTGWTWDFLLEIW